MIQGKIVSQGLESALNAMTQESGSDWYTGHIRLYSNSVVLGYNTVYANFTECTFAGYSAQVFGAWNTASPAGDSIHAYTQFGYVIFNCTAGGGSGNIYGSFWTIGSGNSVIAADVFAGAPVTLSNGQSYFYFPTLQSSSEF